MTHLLKRLWLDRRGNVLVVAAAALPLVVGSAGLATDTIQWAMWKRQLQRSADSAALAGVHGIVQGQNVQEAATRDLALNARVEITSQEIQNSPSAGGYTSDPRAVRVVLTTQRELGFSSLFLQSAPVITATATATIVPHGNYCVVSLEDTATTGINIAGSTTVDLGCGMITNSTGGQAAVATGSAIVNATPIAAVGGIPPSESWGANVQLLPYNPPQEDPFAQVEPTTPTGTCPNLEVSPNQTATLNPGCYNNLTLKGNVTLADGTYVLDGGSLVIESQATVRCNSCTFVFTNRSTASSATIGTVSIAGGATLDLSAPTTGTYAGILMYQDRRASGATNYVRGSSSSSFQGAFYFPGQTLEFAGTSGMSTECVQLVARRVTLAGSSAISNNCPANSGANSFEGRSVRLVE